MVRSIHTVSGMSHLYMTGAHLGGAWRGMMQAWYVASESFSPKETMGPSPFRRRYMPSTSARSSLRLPHDVNAPPVTSQSFATAEPWSSAAAGAFPMANAKTC
eukprot:scaffold128_cov248-Pinguiococcus_pyrenoidosus.AAC.11